MKLIKKLFRLSLPEFLHLTEAMVFLVFALFLKRYVPFRFYASLLGNHMALTPEEKLSKPEREKILRVQRALQSAMRNLSLEKHCLELAITAKLMFRLRGIESTVYLGVAKDEAEGLKAHAWIRTGKIIVTGGETVNRYKIISSFA